MNEEKIENNIQKNVLEKIRGGKIHVRSRAYFVFKLVLSVILAACVLVASTLLISFVLFSINESGEQFLLGFGLSGVVTFILLFPWVYLILDIIALVCLERLIKSFKFGYRISFLTIFLSVLICSSLLGVLLNMTPFNRSLLSEADKGSLPIFCEVYESIRDSHQDQGVFRGTISSIHGDMFVMMHTDGDHDEDDGFRTVVFPNPHIPFYVGDRIYVFGRVSANGVVNALGIKKLSNDQ